MKVVKVIVFIIILSVSIGGNSYASSKHVNLPRNTTSYCMNLTALDGVVHNDIIFLAAGFNGIPILHISDENKIECVSKIPSNDFIRSIDIVDNRLFAACETSGVKMFDISDLYNPHLMSEHSDKLNYRQVKAHGDYLYGLVENSIEVFKISDSNLENIRSIPSERSSFNQIQIHNNLIFVVTEINLLIYTTGSIDDIKLIQRIGIPEVQFLIFDGDEALIDNRWVLNISEPGDFYVVDELGNESKSFKRIRDFPHVLFLQEMLVHMLAFKENSYVFSSLRRFQLMRSEHYYGTVITQRDFSQLRPIIHGFRIGRRNYSLCLAGVHNIVLLDITDIDAPRVQDYRTLVASSSFIDANNDRVIVLDSGGYFIMHKIDNDNHLIPLGHVKLDYKVYDIKIKDNFFYMLTYGHRRKSGTFLQIFELDRRGGFEKVLDLEILSEHEIQGGKILAVRDNEMVLLLNTTSVSEPEFIVVYDISNFYLPEKIRSFDFNLASDNVALSSDRYKLYDPLGSMIRIIDMFTGDEVLRTNVDSIPIIDICTDSGQLYVLCAKGGSYSVYLMNHISGNHYESVRIRNILFRDDAQLQPSIMGFLVNDNFAIIATQHNGIYIFDLDDKTGLKYVYHDGDGRRVLDFASEGDYLYYALARQGMNIVRLR